MVGALDCLSRIDHETKVYSSRHTAPLTRKEHQTRRGSKQEAAGHRTTAPSLPSDQSRVRGTHDKTQACSVGDALDEEQGTRESATHKTQEREREQEGVGVTREDDLGGGGGALTYGTSLTHQSTVDQRQSRVDNTRGDGNPKTARQERTLVTSKTDNSRYREVVEPRVREQTPSKTNGGL